MKTLGLLYGLLSQFTYFRFTLTVLLRFLLTLFTLALFQQNIVVTPVNSLGKRQSKKH